MKTLGNDTNAYYRFHAGIYDLTRWAFLFGRGALIRAIAERRPARVLEIGCGTGTNLVALKRLLPEAECIGVEGSAHMLRRAQRKAGDLEIRWVEGMYPSPEVDAALASAGSPDVILFSYVLSMVNPGHDLCIERAQESVAMDGVVCVVDFHSSSYTWFRRWMAMNHVRMESQLRVAVERWGELCFYRERGGLLGLWRYNLMMARART